METRRALVINVIISLPFKWQRWPSGVHVTPCCPPYPPTPTTYLSCCPILHVSYRKPRSSSLGRTARDSTWNGIALLYRKKKWIVLKCDIMRLTFSPHFFTFVRWVFRVKAIIYIIYTWNMNYQLCVGTPACFLRWTGYDRITCASLRHHSSKTWRSEPRPKYARRNPVAEIVFANNRFGVGIRASENHCNRVCF